MSNEILGQDCCGDRYACNTTKACECGCKLTYCSSCYKEHAVEFFERVVKAKNSSKRSEKEKCLNFLGTFK